MIYRVPRGVGTPPPPLQGRELLVQVRLSVCASAWVAGPLALPLLGLALHAVPSPPVPPPGAVMMGATGSWPSWPSHSSLPVYSLLSLIRLLLNFLFNGQAMTFFYLFLSLSPFLPCRLSLPLSFRLLPLSLPVFSPALFSSSLLPCPFCLPLFSPALFSSPIPFFSSLLLPPPLPSFSSSLPLPLSPPL